ncbi:hypothetical protein RJ641_023653 [Dillenia turbinata]|uniref:Uncharacterized protein n=1 Tax=Dillenia turbinata TaxID=194707 RepID=A0AAN8U9Y2_9MAGN
MACLVSTKFSHPFRAFSETLIIQQEIFPKNSNICRISSQESSPKIACKLLARRSFVGGIFWLNQGWHHNLTASWRHFSKHVCNDTNVGSSVNIVILTGYWIGPEIEDGWGFVEAIVNRIT